MENNIKYTTDGKKVVIIGSLNSQEKIVQEVFITASGVELPSGENFVVKSLHDEPVKTWKRYEQDRHEEFEKTFQEENISLKRDIEKQRDRFKIISSALSDKIRWAAKAVESVSPKAFEFLVAFCGGEINYIVTNSYSGYEIKDFTEYVTGIDNDYGREKYDKLRLITLYGSRESESGFEYRVNRYSDGSGSDTNVDLFKTKEDAIEYIKNQLLAKEKYTIGIINNAEQYGIELDEQKLNDFDQSEKDRLQLIIDDHNEKLNELKSNLNNYQRSSVVVNRKKK